MSDTKTRPTDADVEAFLNKVENKTRKEDSFTVMEMMKEVTKMNPVMWGSSVVGFGSYHYKYKTGREGDMPLIGFSPRKQNLTLYIMDGFENRDEILEKLGKYKLGKSCLYINKLQDVDLSVLKEMMQKSLDYMKTQND